MGISGIIIYLIIFIPIYNMIGENMLISISLLLLVYIIVEFIGTFLLRKHKIAFSNIIAILGIIIVYTIFGYLTYFPIQGELFIDPIKNQYGIIQK